VGSFGFTRQHHHAVVEQPNEIDILTAGKAVSPPSSVVLARYSNTVATLGESSTRES